MIGIKFSGFLGVSLESIRSEGKEDVFKFETVFIIGCFVVIQRWLEGFML